MSSPRTAAACDAVLHRKDQVCGPLRLPAKNSSQFIDEFNRVYTSTGLRLQPNGNLVRGKDVEVCDQTTSAGAEK